MPQIHMVAKALIRNADGKFLMLRSSKWEENPERSLKPDLPGGMVEAGETPQQGVAREVYEEAGLRIATERFTLLYTETEFYENTDTSVLRHIFYATVDNADVTLSWEHDEYRWVNADELVASEWRPFYDRANSYIFEHRLIED